MAGAVLMFMLGSLVKGLFVLDLFGFFVPRLASFFFRVRCMLQIGAIFYLFFMELLGVDAAKRTPDTLLFWTDGCITREFSCSW